MCPKGEVMCLQNTYFESLFALAGGVVVIAPAVWFTQPQALNLPFLKCTVLRGWWNVELIEYEWCFYGDLVCIQGEVLVHVYWLGFPR